MAIGLFRRFVSMPMMDADGSGGTGGSADTDSANTVGNEGAGSSAGQPATVNLQVDYKKIADIVAGKQQVAEDTVLKNYFKHQGLSPEEAQQAMEAFKSEKAKNQPDVTTLQQQAQQAEAAAQRAQIEKEATLEALTLGVDVKSIPYVLKLADMGQAIGQDGKINNESIQAALKKVLEDVPAFKPSEQQPSGFRVGAAGNENQKTADQDVLKSAFGL